MSMHMLVRVIVTVLRRQLAAAAVETQAVITGEDNRPAPIGEREAGHEGGLRCAGAARPHSVAVRRS